MQSQRPADFLDLILTDELLTMIAGQTNGYAARRIAAMPTSHHSRHKAWRPVDLKELKDWFGLVFLTGLIRKPELVDYWSTDEAMATPYFGKVMSRNRFQLILKFLHYTDCQEDKDDRLYKMRPILNYLVKKWQELYHPGQKISIDEGTLLWRGRLSFRVYNPAKPIRYVQLPAQTQFC